MTVLLSIGDLAERTGVPVRTIRFYSDSGLLPPAERSGADYRLYGPDAPARLGLVRTLRDLGIDLASIRRVLEREVTVPEIAAAHAAAIDAQIRVLSMQRAVLQAVTRRASDPQEVQTMHKLANLSDEERRRIVADFLDQAFKGLDIEPEFESRMRSAAPELPEDPTQEQVDAWIELAELVQDDEFRASIRRMSEQHAATRDGGETGDPAAAAALVTEHAGRARATGVEPGTAEAERTLSAIVPAFGEVSRAELADRLETGTDPRAERYWQLLGMLNGWPPAPSTVADWEWLIAALRAG